jgi:hypothetical protein
MAAVAAAVTTMVPGAASAAPSHDHGRLLGTVAAAATGTAGRAAAATVTVPAGPASAQSCTPVPTLCADIAPLFEDGQ